MAKVGNPLQAQNSISSSKRPALSLEQSLNLPEPENPKDVFEEVQYFRTFLSFLRRNPD